MLKQENLAQVTIKNHPSLKGSGWDAFLVRFESDTTYGSFECALIPFLGDTWCAVPMRNIEVDTPPREPIDGPPYEIDE